VWGCAGLLLVSEVVAAIEGLVSVKNRVWFCLVAWKVVNGVGYIFVIPDNY
jgi:hypothetical protein